MIEEITLNKFDTKYFIKEIGYVIVRKLYEHLDITDVFIEENFRRQGYAYKILKYIIDNNKDYKIMLEVNEENIPAINPIIANINIFGPIFDSITESKKKPNAVPKNIPRNSPP